MSDTFRKAAGIALIVVATVFSFGTATAFAIKLAGTLMIASGAKKSKTQGGTSLGNELQLGGDPLATRKICYGEAWTAGDLRFRQATAVDNRDLYMVIVLAGHECDDVVEVQADREPLTLDGSGNVTLPSKWAGRINIRYYLGTDSQTADATLVSAFPTEWTSDHRLRGLTYAIVKLSFDENDLNAIPQFRFKVRGRKVYDPRLDTTQTGGSGSHRLNTPSTWEWSRNPVLCASDLLGGVLINSKLVAGVGIDRASRHDWANVMAEANVCEEDVALDAGGDEDRYTVDGFIDPRQEPGELIRHFELAIGGDILESDNKWRFFCGAYRTPSLHLLPDHFVGPLQIEVQKGEIDTFDMAEGQYVSLADGGALVNFAPVTLASAVAGSERATSIDFQLVSDSQDSPGTDGGARCQRIAKLWLERDAAGKRINCTTNLYGLRAVPGETIQITHAAFGLSAQTMRVIEVAPKTYEQEARTGLLCDLVLEAGPSSIYAWTAEETAIGVSPALIQALVNEPPVLGSWTPVLTTGMRRSQGNTFTKVGGAANTFDESVYSLEGYARCAVAFTVLQDDTGVAIGLDASPSGSHNMSSIDGCWVLDGSTTDAYVYQSGAQVHAEGSYAIGDRFAIVRNGPDVLYYHNSDLVFRATTTYAARYLDTSFYSVGASVGSLTFGPIESVDTWQIDIGAATVVYQLDEAGPVDFSCLSGDNTERGWITYLAAEVGATTDMIEVTASFGVDLTSPGTSPSVYVGVSEGVTNPSGAAVSSPKNTAGFEARAMVGTFTGITPGTHRFGIEAKITHNPAGGDTTVRVTDAEIQVTVVKR